MSKKHKKMSKTFSYFEHTLILTSAFTGFFSIYSFASVVVIPLWITSSAIALKTFDTILGTRAYKSIIKKKKNENNKIVMFTITKTKLNAIQI